MDRARGGSPVLVELIRLAVVVAAVAGVSELSGQLRLLEAGETLAESVGETRFLVALTLAAAVGYVLGGVLGRLLVGSMDAVEQGFREVPTGELLAGAIGAAAGLLLAGALVWPVFLFGGRLVTVPLAVLVMIVLSGTGARLGRARGADLLRFLGVSGRLRPSSPTRGPGAKLVDTSVLIDGRLVDVCRAGFLDGALVVPAFVLNELQGLADAGDDERRARGRRGLDVLAALQRAGGVTIEVAEQDYPELADVDAKLLAMARERGAALLTVDGNLGRVAEVQGVRVLNLHALAETLRPPVLPGDELRLRVTRPGKEAAQGVGHLADGTMVVVEGARERVGDDVDAEVTSVLATSNGRMIFARMRS